jgi:hypothetical protein
MLVIAVLLLLCLYCDVFGRMPSLLCNRKLDTPVVARQPKVKHLHGYARNIIAPLYVCNICCFTHNLERQLHLNIVIEET